MRLKDSELYARLVALFEGEGTATITPRNDRGEPYDVQVRVEVLDNHRGDSPDAILRLSITMVRPPLPELRLVIPVPLEGEKGGIPAAREDLVKFAEREHFPIQLPMLVVGGEGNPAQSAQKVQVRTDVRINLVPLRRLLPPSEEG